MKMIIFYLLSLLSFTVLAVPQNGLKLLDLKENESVQEIFSSSKEDLMWVQVDRWMGGPISQRLILINPLTGKVLSEEIVTRDSQVQYRSVGEYIMSTTVNDKDEKVVILRTFDHKRRYQVNLEAYGTMQFLVFDEARQELLLYNLIQRKDAWPSSDIPGGYDLRVIDARTMKLKDIVKFRHPLFPDAYGVVVGKEVLHFKANYPFDWDEDLQIRKNFVVNARKAEVTHEFISDSAGNIRFMGVLGSDNYVIRTTKNNRGFFYSFISLIDNTESQNFLFLPLSAGENRREEDDSPFMVAFLQVPHDDTNIWLLSYHPSLNREIRLVNRITGEVLWRLPEPETGRRVDLLNLEMDRVIYANENYGEYVCARISTGEIVFMLNMTSGGIKAHRSDGSPYVAVTSDLLNGKKKLQIYSVMDGSIRKFSTPIEKYIGMTTTSTPVWLGVVKYCIRRSKPEAGEPSVCQVYGQALKAWSL